jgi:hypothetical protein
MWQWFGSRVLAAQTGACCMPRVCSPVFGALHGITLSCAVVLGRGHPASVDVLRPSPRTCDVVAVTVLQHHSGDNWAVWKVVQCWCGVHITGRAVPGGYTVPCRLLLPQRHPWIQLLVVRKSARVRVVSLLRHCAASAWAAHHTPATLAVSVHRFYCPASSTTVLGTGVTAWCDCATPLLLSAVL